MFRYLKNKKTKEPHISEIDLFSDNTCAQNKNRYVAFSLWYACKHIKYERITHTFLEVGHTETENDNVHSMIEQRTRNITINTPEQWYSAVRLAGPKKNSYTVFELSKTDFIDWKTMSNECVKHFFEDDSGKQVYWSNVRQIKITQEDSEKINVRTEFGGEWQVISVFRKKRQEQINRVKMSLFSLGFP